MEWSLFPVIFLIFSQKIMINDIINSHKKIVIQSSKKVINDIIYNQYINILSF